MYKKRLIIDIDGTICEEGPTFSRSLVKPLPRAIKCVNQLYEKGYHITLYTARGWAELDMTKNWLDKYKIKYHVLLCGKPVYDIWIDDKALHFSNWKDIEHAI